MSRRPSDAAGESHPQSGRKTGSPGPPPTPPDMRVTHPGAGVDPHGSLTAAVGLGAVWGATGSLGALLAYATGAAGRQVPPSARVTDGVYGRTEAPPCGRL